MPRLDRSQPTDRDRPDLLRRTFAVLNDDVRTKGDQLLLRLQKVAR